MKTILFIATFAAAIGCLLSWSATGPAAAGVAEVDWDRVLRRGSASAQGGGALVGGEIDRPYSRGAGTFDRGVVSGPDDGQVRVEVLHTLSSEAMRDVVEDAGGEVYGEVPGVLAEALVPRAGIEEIESADGVTSVRPPLQASIPMSAEPVPADLGEFQDSVTLYGEEIEKTNADVWHAAGYTGQGVQVGIIDYFDGTTWDGARSHGELSEITGVFCQAQGNPCDIWSSGSPHGVAVAEIISEMAPDAQLFIATAYTTSDTQAAVDFFAANGVDIISRSLTSEYDGPGDGTGPMAAVIDSAVAQGMLWVNSAGNSAGNLGVSDGSHWMGTWSNPDADEWLNFDGGMELIGFFCSFINGLRWDDWAAGGRTDYDLVIFDTLASVTPKTAGIQDQVGGAPPLEHVNGSLVCSGPGDVDYIAVTLWDAGAGAEGDTLEIMGNQTQFSDWTNPYAASAPASDSANLGAVAIGAVDPALGTTIASYSSHGPTWDGRLKPDLSAAACVASYSYSPSCFNGTSAATPVAAGAAAVVMSSGLASVPEGLAMYLRSAVEDRGIGGPDVVFGTGELTLPAPPSVSTPTPVPTAEPTSTPTSAASPPPGPTNTPAPTATPEPTSTATAEPTNPSGTVRTWGDMDCDGGLSSRDSQAVMRNVLQQNALSQTQPCPAIGGIVLVTGYGILIWGDSDCDGAITSRDNQSLMRVLLIQVRLSQTQPCPGIGEAVDMSA